MDTDDESFTNTTDGHTMAVRKNWIFDDDVSVGSMITTTSYNGRSVRVCLKIKRNVHVQMMIVDGTFRSAFLIKTTAKDMWFLKDTKITEPCR